MSTAAAAPATSQTRFLRLLISAQSFSRSARWPNGLDEVGYIPFDQDAAHLFFQLMASRYEQGSIMVTSNLPFGLRQRRTTGE
jgi:hypothetical protein